MLGKKIYYKDLGLGMIVEVTGEHAGEGHIHVIFNKEPDSIYKIPRYQLEQLERNGKLKWEKEAKEND